jgi:hypothetical protein
LKLRRPADDILSGEARELLAPIYAWFTERLATRDLTEAEARAGGTEITI